MIFLFCKHLNLRSLSLYTCKPSSVHLTHSHIAINLLLRYLFTALQLNGYLLAYYEDINDLILE